MPSPLVGSTDPGRKPPLNCYPGGSGRTDCWPEGRNGLKMCGREMVKRGRRLVRNPATRTQVSLRPRTSILRPGSGQFDAGTAQEGSVVSPCWWLPPVNNTIRAIASRHSLAWTLRKRAFMLHILGDHRHLSTLRRTTPVKGQTFNYSDSL